MEGAISNGLSALLLIAFVYSGYCWFRLLRRRWTFRPTATGQPTADHPIGAPPQQRRVERETRSDSQALSPYAAPPTAEETLADDHDLPAPPEAAEQGKRPPLVALEPRERPFWGPADFLILVGVFLVSSVLFQVVLGALEGPAAVPPTPVTEPVDGGAEESARSPVEGLRFSLITHSLSSITAMLIVLGVLHLKSDRVWSQLGLIPAPSDLRLGLASALLILPPVMLLMGAVSYLVPYQHPVLDLLTASPSLSVFSWLFVSTVVVTPVVEEFALRVILQGGLQGVADSGRIDPAAPAGRRWWPQSDWPILVTSLFFAVLHAGQGLAPIPLFFLSCGLGYLYRQTGRIYPPLIVHMVLNGITMLVTFTELFSS